MIENISDLGLDSLDSLEPEALLLKLNEILLEKLGLDLDGIKKPLMEYVVSHAGELSLEMPNIVPHGDYEKIIEDNDGMTNFLKTEAADLKNWYIKSISQDDKFDNLLKFSFGCASVDDGESLSGTVFVSKLGKIKHAFAQTS